MELYSKKEMDAVTKPLVKENKKLKQQISKLEIKLKALQADYDALLETASEQVEFADMESQEILNPNIK